MKGPPYGLSNEVVAKLTSVFQEFPAIEKVVIYGSRAKGNFKTGSDIDLVIVAPEMSLSDLMKIENQIDDLLLPYKMDLSLLHKIDNEDLVDHINRAGAEFFRRE